MANPLPHPEPIRYAANARSAGIRRRETTIAKTTKIRGKVLEALRRSPLVCADLDLAREWSNGRRFKGRTKELEVHVGGSLADVKRRVLDAVERSKRGEFVAGDHLSLPESIKLSAVNPEKD